LFLLEPAQTPYDLRWRMFGIDIRVHPMFWLVSAILGWNAMDLGFPFLLLWIACVFVSILVHELGHVGMGLLCGAEGHVVLYSFGGLAIGSSNLRSRSQRIAVYLAGPLAGFAFLGVLYLMLRLLVPARADSFLAEIGVLLGFSPHIPLEHLATTMMNEALWDLIQINLFWGFMNLLPVYPLDGGQISREVFNWFMRGRGIRAALGLSMFVAGLIAFNAIASHAGHPLPLVGRYLPSGLYIALLFGLLALSNYQELQQVKSYTRTWDYKREPWERDPDYWKK
jgi:Zn-dependent protease